MATIVIGGIRYTSDNLPSEGTSHLGVACCPDCLQSLLSIAAAGDAVSTAPGDFVIQTRIAILKRLRRLPNLDFDGNETIMKFLVLGDIPGGSGSGPILGATHYLDSFPEARRHEAPLRCVIAYLIHQVMTGGASLVNDITNKLAQHDSAFEATQRNLQPFTCRCCSESITDRDVIRNSRFITVRDGSVREDERPSVCADCLSSRFVYSAYLARYYPAETRMVEVVGLTGWVPIAYARSNFYHNEARNTFHVDRPPPTNALLAYNANPFDSFTWDTRNRPNALVFGIELEMEPVRSSNQTNLIEALGGNVGKQFILKSDGSLTDGVELVTMPFTMSQHLDNTGVPWNALLEAVKAIGMSGRNTNNCGMHIHINKKALSALTIGKMLVFLNSPHLEPLITLIAQRGNNSYTRRGNKKLTDGTRSSENRYDMLNVSVRHPTCEMRMFRGNLTPERVYKNVEFCHALVQYCRQSSMVTLCEWGQFADWLIAHRGQYQNLSRFLIDANCVGFKHLSRDTRDGTVTIEDR